MFSRIVRLPFVLLCSPGPLLLSFKKELPDFRQIRQLVVYQGKNRSRIRSRDVKWVSTGQLGSRSPTSKHKFRLYMCILWHNYNHIAALPR
ncbi:hypothetical protein B0J17DRAFT_664975, partial [Rhizoctonia solani]